MASGIENPVDAELERIAGLGGLESFDGALRCADDRSRQVTTTSVVAKVLAPGSVGLGGLLDEYIFMGCWKIIEISHWNLKILVGIVKPGPFFVVVVLFRIRHFQ